MKPRNFRFAAMLAILLAFALPSVQTIQASARPAPTHGSAAPTPGSRPLVPLNTAGVTGGTLFGGTYPLVAEQGKLGRKLSIVRIYYMIGQKFTPPSESDAAR